MQAARGPPTPTSGAARLLTLAGMWIQAGQVGLFFVVAYSVSALPTAPFLALGAAGVAWVLLVFVFSYRPMRRGELLRARNPTLLFAVLSILTVGVISGLLYALAYHELGKAVQTAASPGGPRSPVLLQTGSRVCPICNKANPLSTSFCQSCGFVLG